MPIAEAATIRRDVKGVPKAINDALERVLFDLKQSTGIDVSIKDAVVRGMVLATEELKHARGPNQIRKIYDK